MLPTERCGHPCLILHSAARYRHAAQNAPAPHHKLGTCGLGEGLQYDKPPVLITRPVPRLFCHTALHADTEFIIECRAALCGMHEWEAAVCTCTPPCPTHHSPAPEAFCNTARMHASSAACHAQS